jgi:hypothetical protein
MTRITFVAFLALVSVGAFAGEMHSCDVEAAHPSDPDHVGEGKSSDAVVTHRAIPACREAVREFPEEARFHYQLGRAIVYWAGANDADYSEGMKYLENAAAMEYTQAMFVLGLMYQREGKVCASEPLTRKAAGNGLKSARIAYVNSVTAGDYDDCSIAATASEMRAYLDGAVSQVSGYYESMLLASLRRQLEARTEAEL